MKKNKIQAALALAAATQSATPFYGAGRMPLRNFHLDPHGTEGGALSETEFQTKVLRGMEAAVKTQEKHTTDIQKVLGDLDRTDKEVKKAMEELTGVKNATNATVTEINQKMEKLQKSIALNTRSSFRSPIARALANEEFRFHINALARYIIAQKTNTKCD